MTGAIDPNTVEITDVALENIERKISGVPVPSSGYCPDEETELRFHLHVLAPMMVREIRRRRSEERRPEKQRERPLTEERVREVVRDAAVALLDERKLYIVKLVQPTMNDIVLEVYGHGRACDAAALQGEDLQAVLAAIATRAAKELAGHVVALSQPDRVRLRRVRDLLRQQPVHWDLEEALLDRLLAAAEPTPASDVEHRVMLQSAGERIAELHAMVAQREADLREAFLAGIAHGEGWLTDEAREAASGPDEDAAAEYARSKAGDAAEQAREEAETRALVERGEIASEDAG